MITTVSCGLSLQLTCQLVNLSTRQLQIMITTVKKPTHLFVLLGK